MNETILCEVFFGGIRRRDKLYMKMEAGLKRVIDKNKYDILFSVLIHILSIQTR